MDNKFKTTIQRFLYTLIAKVGFDAISRKRITRYKNLRKLGSPHGGWVIPTELLNKESICYLAGCGEDISFDLELIKQFGCDVYAFDPTPKAVRYVKTKTKSKKYKFFKIGLWDKKGSLKFYFPKNKDHVSHSLLNLQKTHDYIKVSVDSLKNIAKKNKHKKIDLLKIDIEGAEYKVLNSISKDKLEVKIICVEFDEMFHPMDEMYLQRIREQIQKLISSGYQIVHSEGNGNYTFIKTP